MYPANITRREAAARSAVLSAHTARVTVDLSGGFGGLDYDPALLFGSSSTLRFHSDAKTDTWVNLIADRLISATLDGRPLRPDAFRDHKLHFRVRTGDHTLVVTALCRFSRTGEGLHRFVDPVDSGVYCFTQFETADARRMYACFEQPDLKARFDLTVVAPSAWTVLANSPAVRPVPVADGVARWDFAPTPPISSYITALVAGGFHTVTEDYPGRGGTIPLTLACRASLAPHLDADRIFATTRGGFEVFEEAFGRPYPFADYLQVFVPEFNAGAMENAGCVTIRDEYLYRSRVTNAAYETRDNTILHELAHMWFGDLVTMKRWDDLWLNESFAEWASHFCQAELRARTGVGDDPWATFCNARKNWAYRADQLPSTHPVAADMVDLEAVELNFDGITYAKGASVIRQLVASVGQDAFLAGVRAYFADHAWGNTTFDDLLAALTAASGRDLSSFASDWLRSAGVNTLRAEFETDADGVFTWFAIRQTATEQWPTLRHHRMAVGSYNPVEGRLRRTDRVEIDIAGELTEVPEMVGRQRPALLLPNDDDLTYAKIRLDAGSLRTLIAGIGTLDSALARALCWGAAWDMCRDAELGPADFVALVLAGIDAETDSTAVGSLLGQGRTAIDFFTPPELRAGSNEQFVAGIARLLKGAQPGSDHQLNYARALASAATTPAQTDVVLAWLAGEESPQGLAIDTDLRWHLLTQLARAGAVGDAEIDAEFERDQTARGAEQAAGARAALPDPGHKADAWRLATVADTPNETQHQLCANFWQVGQDEVLLAYLPAYADLAARISAGTDGWSERSSAIRQNALALLFPRTVLTRARLAEFDAWLATAGLSDSVARQVGERRDDAERALRCQEAALTAPNASPDPSPAP